MSTAKFFLRGFVIGAYLFWHALRWFLGWLTLLVTFRGRTRRQTWFGACLVELFNDLGATFIKVAQIMSSRPDLFPPHVIAALETLQDRVRPFAYELVREILVADLGRPPEELFETFDPRPIASASVAQVHRATLPGGKVMAVKVRRPRLDELCEFDLKVLRLFARILAISPSLRRLAPVETVEEFGKAIRMQLDLRIERENNVRFTKMFAGDPDVVFPVVDAELSSRHVLTMDFIEGKKILQFDRAVDDPRRLAKIGFRVLFKMAFEEGFIHADLHPGNILITPEGKVAILDLGLTGTIEAKLRAHLVEMLVAAASEDGRGVARIAMELSPGREEIPDPEGFAAEVDAMAKKMFFGKSLGQIDVVQLLLQVMNIMRRHRVRVNPAFTLFNIAAGVVQGVGQQLDSQLDLLQEAMPYVMKLQSMRMARTP